MSSGAGLRNEWRSNVSSSILARYRLGQSRRQSRSRPAAKRAAGHRWAARPSALTFELIEPRLLLSADVFPGTQAGRTPARRFAYAWTFSESRFVRTHLRSVF